MRPLTLKLPSQRAAEESEAVIPVQPKPPVTGEQAKAQEFRHTGSADASWERWRTTQDPGDFQQTLKALDPVISKGVSAFGGGRDTLRTRARVLAADAIRAYDPEKAKGMQSRASLSTYVYSHMQRLNRVAADREAAVRLPERNRVDAAQIRDAVIEYQDRYDREPDLATLQDITGLSRKRIQLASRAYRELSTSGLETEKGDTLLVTDDESEPDVWTDYVYHDLDAKNRKIFEWTTGYGGSKVLPKQEIAKRLRLSPSAVSARIGKIVKLMEQRPAGELL